MLLASTATRRLRAGPPHGQRVAPATRALRRARTTYSPTQRSDEPHTPQKSSAAGHAALSFEGDVATRSGCGRARPHAKGRFVAGGTTGPADNNTPIDRQPSDDYHVAVAELAEKCDANHAVIQALVKKGLVVTESATVERDPSQGETFLHAGKLEMNRIRERDAQHPIEQVGKGLRSMFSWLKAA
jgi:hypothetical protein